MKSVRRQLLIGLLSGLMLGVAAAGVRIYVQTLDEANELFDYHLKQMAASLPADGFSPLPPSRLEERFIADELVVQIWDRSGVQLYFSHPGSRLPARAELGFSTVVTPQGSWRVYSVLDRNNVVQVAQPMSMRRELAAGMALRSVVPLLLLLPVLGVLIWLTVGRGMRPLRLIAKAVAQRSPSSLHPLSERGVPAEISPVVHALNDLLGRLGRALSSQKAFVSDAAHELRTPLAAVQLQTQLAERATTDEERKAAFADLRQGLARASHVVQQLLTLARQEPGAAQTPFAPVDLAELAREVVAEQAPLAGERNIDLGLVRQDAAMVQGDRDALRVMLGNLVDNAIRYSPPGGTVDVAVGSENARAAIRIEDTGPGIAAEERERVFDRFYRGHASQAPGSGLGLAIVKNIAERHDAAIVLENRTPGPGLRASVIFPPAQAASAQAGPAAPPG